jgi:hypothetical protein
MNLIKWNVAFIAVGFFFLVSLRTFAQESSKSAVYPVSNDVSVELSSDWHTLDNAQLPPPAALASYGPPFHFSKILTFTNAAGESILQIGASDNPLVGHDAYWLDTQMHSPSGSGMSMADFLFYLFLPPSASCMDQISQHYASASRVSALDESSPSDLQVSYACPPSATLPDFYAARLSSGITFRHGTSRGSHALGQFRDFYVSPMEEVSFSGMTFFIFEAQQTEQLTQDTTDYFDLPDAVRGAQPDFFWAIGAPSPFPFVQDPSRENVPLVHIGYAAVGNESDNRSEFVEVLHHLQKR